MLEVTVDPSMSSFSSFRWMVSLLFIFIPFGDIFSQSFSSNDGTAIFLNTDEVEKVESSIGIIKELEKDIILHLGPKQYPV